MSKPSFAKGIKKEIKSPIIVHQGSEQIDKFTGHWKYMKTKKRNKVLITLTTAFMQKQEAIDTLVKQKAAEKLAYQTVKTKSDKGDDLSKEDKKILSEGKNNDFEVTEDEILNAWVELDKELFNLINTQLNYCTMAEGDDREWTDNTLEELFFEYPEYKDGFIASLTRLSKGIYTKVEDTKN